MSPEHASTPVTLSVVIPTFNNEAIVRRAIESWQTFAATAPIEVIVVEDGCRDGTKNVLTEISDTPWGRTHFRWIHMDDAHELRCTNAGFRIARGQLVMAWQDDMFLKARWLPEELIEVFDRHGDVGLLGLSRGLDMFPVDEPVERWEDLQDWRRMKSTIGPFPWNWLRIQEVDSTIRPWVIRRDCLERVGLLDEAFVPTEWDEADLAFRVRAAGWKVATCGYERLGAYRHVGSSTLGTLSDDHKARVLRNGRLFHQRWDPEIVRSHARRRATWPRPLSLERWAVTGIKALRAVPRRLTEPRS
ncbi:MAG: glycosyltransferase family 2 protein [Vicinamibacterales bacterium]